MSAETTQTQQKSSSSDKKEGPFKVGDLIQTKWVGAKIVREVLYVIPDGDLVTRVSYPEGEHPESFHVLKRHHLREFEIYTPPPKKGKLFVRVYKRASDGGYFLGNSSHSKESLLKINAYNNPVVAILEVDFEEGQGLDES